MAREGHGDRFRRSGLHPRTARGDDGHEAQKVGVLLPAELKREGVSYAQLTEKLGELGIEESERKIANKIDRGGFTAVFMLQCLDAIGSEALRLKY